MMTNGRSGGLLNQPKPGDLKWTAELVHYIKARVLSRMYSPTTSPLPSYTSIRTNYNAFFIRGESKLTDAIFLTLEVIIITHHYLPNTVEQMSPHLEMFVEKDWPEKIR